MSFMFNPYPYDDPNAFNVLDPSGLPLSELVEGSGASAAAEAAKAAGALKRAEGWVIAVDGYSTAPLDTFRNLLEQQLRANPLGLWGAVRYAAAPMRPEDLSGYHPHEGYAAPQARRVPEYRY